MKTGEFNMHIISTAKVLELIQNHLNVFIAREGLAAFSNAARPSGPMLHEVMASSVAGILE